ncbi:hypothetical protein AYO21_00731 [Fonsecaea monophora]|uniref:Uncharacterized protein n=1 Tax=Fonsecaea monophora TaxID=254056 RepID=A0A177FLU5_9EURO|nr:hypothetical protein AYO21_00731 [Fonsecaea monophora]KAH0848489.1 hypothetical protein FOPE_02543 [Fonsecaea pedrosoi]OAG44771.1 hypothetical protein AYO21_00731 [Fonsecaea monophora]
MSILNRFRGRSAGGDQAQVDPHQWRLPSSYSTSSKPGTRETVIPNPRIFRNAFVPNETTAARIGADSSLVYPDVSHAAVHLALLESFQRLRLSAASRLDDVEVVEDQPPPAFSEDEKRDVLSEQQQQRQHRPPTSTKLPEPERWDLLIRLAITRFTAWWMNMDRILYHATAFTHHAGTHAVVQLTKDYLPPLDVLLVWYAFMLDEESYTTACSYQETPSARIGDLCFPWPAIRDALDLDSMAYRITKPAENLFATLTSQSADILTYLEGPPAYVECPELPVDVDLFAQVKRCERFMDEAHRLLWIRSPSLQGSLERASLQYLERQLSPTPISRVAAAAGQDDTSSPLPFGVELIWKTHRLYPRLYRLFRQEIVPAPTPTDTKSPRISTAPESLDDSDVPERGSRQPSFSKEYDECYCWTCERIRDDIPTFSYTAATRSSSSSSLSSSSPRAAADAISPSPLSTLSQAQIRSIQDDLGFHLAVEKARARHSPLPTRPPTAAEKAAERLEAKKQAEVGRLPGLNEYLVTMPNGKKKIKRSKHTNMVYTAMV